ncbi:MAG: hypothetical protein HQL56_06845 [Magnetococcales bacterium]|nr:hypothetical protein [Magnetococcales bacterium]
MSFILHPYITARLREPSSWASIGAAIALFTGHDPEAVSATVAQVAGGVAVLWGIFGKERGNG